MTADGPVPVPPSDIRAALVASVESTNPGFTANLPASLIEDITSTDVAAIAEADSARVETLNSLTPLGANAWLLTLLGQIYGVQQGEETNTSVEVVFSGPAGYVIAQGFVVSDGTYQYICNSGGVIGEDGQSPSLYCVATISGSWAIPPGTVTNLVTQPPSGLDPELTCSNPLAGVPAVSAETMEKYRSRVLRSGSSPSQGCQSRLKDLLSRVEGVQERLISIRQTATGWIVICGGGDPYEVAYAIWTAILDIATLEESALSVVNVTGAANGVVTVDHDHNYSDGEIATIEGMVGMEPLNGVPITVTVVSPTTFSTGINTSGYPAYVSGGTVTPVLRNEEVSLQDFPDTYQVKFVRPPQQDVQVSLVWDTTATNFVSSASVAQLGTPAIVDYINSIYAGQPINVYQMQAAFMTAIESVLPRHLLTRMSFTVSINGVSTPPESGTGIIIGDPESYFLTDSTQVSIIQG